MLPDEDPNTPNQIYIMFFKHPARNEARSEKAGRPVFDEKDYIKKVAPGGKNNIVMRPVRATDKQEFPQQWAAYVQGLEVAVSGTPVSECPKISQAQAEELKYFHITTLEQLVAAPATVNMMGINGLKQAAESYLDVANAGVSLAEFKSQNEDLKAQIEELKGLIGVSKPSIAASESQVGEEKAGEENAGDGSETSDKTPAKKRTRRVKAS